MSILKLLKTLVGREKREIPSSKEVLEEQNSMIEGIRQLCEKQAKEIMVPRVDVTALPLTVDHQELYKTVIESGFSRVPIYGETVDDLVGILYVKDLLKCFVGGGMEFDISNVMRDPYFVPESIKLDVLLKELKRRKTHLAIVVDEYGGISGLVSLEDIVEEIIGDVQDEFDNEEEEIVPMEDGSYFCDARTNLDKLSETLGIDFGEEVETLGGFLFDLLGRIPTQFERIQYKNLIFVIQSIDGNKIEKVKVLIATEGESKEAT